MYRVVYVIDKHTGRVKDIWHSPQVKLGLRIDARYHRASVNDVDGILSKPFRNSFHGGRVASCFVPNDRVINRSL